MIKQRYWNLSLYRIIAAICILQFHIFYILYNRDIPYETLLSKCVQGFTVLSGFLYSQKIINNKKEFYLSNTRKILIPAALCFLLMLVWNLIYMLSTQQWNYVSLFFDKRPYNGALLAQPGNFYYIFYILICYLITPLLQKGRTTSKILTGGGYQLKFV